MDAFMCTRCGEPSDEKGCSENDWCVGCYEKWFNAEMAYWKPLYEGEKQAGLIDDEKMVQ